MINQLDVGIGFVVLLICLFLIGSHSDNVKRAIKGVAITAVIGLLLYYAIRYTVWPGATPLIIPAMMLALALGKIREDRNSSD